MTRTVCRIIILIACIEFGCAATKKPKVPKMFTSKSEMEKIVETEKKLYEIISNYTSHLEKRLEKVKALGEELRVGCEQASSGVESYLNNPISAFLFTRRLLTTRDQLESIMAGEHPKAWARDFQIKRKLRGYAMPESQELEYAAAQVKRLQTQYQLNATEMASGSPYGVTLTSGDCFDLGKDAYEEEDFDLANDWLQEALSRIDDEQAKIEDVMEYLAATAYLQGRLRKALELTEKLTSLSPALSNKATNNIKYYKKMIAEIESKKAEAERQDVVADVVNWLREDVDEFTDKICQRQISLSPNIAKHLTCRLVDRGHPFLLLAKLKEEVLFKTPRVVLYHDMLSVTDTESLVQVAQAQALPHGKDSNLITHASSAVLADLNLPPVAAAARRAAHLSGYDVTHADLLQVLSYDVNGTMKPHFDRQQPSSVVVRHSGNKLATVQFFLNDSDGGDTVFPALKLAVAPRRGSALFWVNLKRNGQTDDLTMHGSCPVRSGQHWQAVKWLRTFGNEFIYPCGRSQNA